MLNTQRLDKHESSIAFNLVAHVSPLGPPERLPGRRNRAVAWAQIDKSGPEVKHGLFVERDAAGSWTETSITSAALGLRLIE